MFIAIEIFIFAVINLDVMRDNCSGTEDCNCSRDATVREVNASSVSTKDQNYNVLSLEN